jgi:hypothetical protein
MEIVKTLENLHQRLSVLENASLCGNLGTNLADEIISKIIELIKDPTLNSKYCIRQIQEIIRPNLVGDKSKDKAFGSKLKGDIVKLLPNQDWARSDRSTHKYVKVIWDSLKGLELWE